MSTEPTSATPLPDASANLRGGPPAPFVGVLLLAVAVAVAFAVADTWLRISLCAWLTAAAYGVWQDARRRRRYLLEPEGRPTPRIGVTDSLVCVLLILLLELFGAPLAAQRLKLDPWPAQAVTFLVSISLVGVGASFLFRRRGVRGLRGSLGLTWGISPRVALRRGLSWAAAAVGVAVIGALALRYWPWLQSLNDGPSAVPYVADPRDRVILLLLTCVGAPVVEELLFRGMLYRSLRESLSPRSSALFAAGVFAAIHPGLAFVPLFVLSVFAAASFEQSRSLASPILVHVAYNTSLFIVSGVLGGA